MYESYKHVYFSCVLSDWEYKKFRKLFASQWKKKKPFLILWSIAQYPKVSFLDLTFIRFKHFKIFNSNLLHCWQPVKKFHRERQREREREKLMSLETIKTGEKRINRTKKIMMWGKLKKEIKKQLIKSCSRVWCIMNCSCLNSSKKKQL